MEEEKAQYQAICALTVVAVSGFLDRSYNAQASCLGLCNASREGVPTPIFKIRKGVPPSFLQMLYPWAQARVHSASRVLPYRKVLTVELELALSRGYAESDSMSKVFESMGIGDVQWPEGTKEIRLCFFDRAIDAVTWPESLERLVLNTLEFKCSASRSALESFFSSSFAPFEFHEHFNHTLDGAIFPAGLREIFLGMGFDQPIEHVAWPPGLERLSMPTFQQPLDNVQWPSRLKSLEFMPPEYIALHENGMDTCPGFLLGFNQPLGDTLPASLESLWLSGSFCQPLDNVTWPAGLTKMGFGAAFGRVSISEVSWPSTLKQLFFVYVHKDGYGETPIGCDVSAAKMQTDDDEHELSPEEVEEWEIDGGAYGDYEYDDPESSEDYDSDGSNFSL